MYGLVFIFILFYTNCMHVMHVLQINQNAVFFQAADNWYFAQSAGAVEYTDCTSAWG